MALWESIAVLGLFAGSACFVEPDSDPTAMPDSDGGLQTDDEDDDDEDGAGDDGQTSTSDPSGEGTTTGPGDDADGDTTGGDDQPGSDSASDSEGADSSGTGEVAEVVLFDFYDSFCGIDVQRTASEPKSITVLLCGLGGTPLPYLDTQAAIETPTGQVARAIVMDFPALPISAMYSMVGLLPLAEANDPRFTAVFECGEQQTGFYQYSVMLVHADGTTSDPSLGVHNCGDDPTPFEKELPTDENVGVAIAIFTTDALMRRIVIADPVVVDTDG